MTTSTYEARAFGVHSGMGVMKSAQLRARRRAAPRRLRRVPEVLAPVQDGGALHRAARRGPRHRRDLRRPRRCAGRAATTAAAPSACRLKEAVKAATGLTCSIGVTPNKLLSKICSDLDKPDGLTLLEPRDIPARIWPLPARKVNGIGPKATVEARRARHPHDRRCSRPPTGAGCCSASARASAAGCTTHRTAATIGRSSRAASRRSISRETTFDRDLHAVRDRAELGRDVHAAVRTTRR